MEADAPSLESPLHCPGCGFDLRGTQSDRCGECGLVIDRAALLHTEIPWAYRRRLGYVRAYLKTFWQITFDRQSLRQEASKPQSLSDARVFSRITATTLAASFVAAFAAGLYIAGGWPALAIQPDSRLAQLYITTKTEAAAIPWCAGATILPTLPLCLIGLAIYLTGSARFVLRAPGLSTDYQRNATTLAIYGTAPLMLLAPALICILAPPLLAERFELESQNFPSWFLALKVVGPVLVVTAIAITFIRIGQWAERTRHCGFFRAALASIEMLALWLLGAIVLLGLVPWCIGFLWIAIDSLR